MKNTIKPKFKPLSS